VAKPEPPHDCRITIRCLKATFGFKLPLGKTFADLRTESSLIDKLFDQRENDHRGGEGGERVRQIRGRPAFKLTSGRMRGATWFDVSRPPQGIVWLLGAEMHDERHKGRRDAYDLLAEIDARGELFPQEIDYKRVELDRRRLDTSSFAEDVIGDAHGLFTSAMRARDSSSTGTLAGVPARVVIERTEAGGVSTAYMAVSTEPVIGPRSGLEFPLTQERFELLAVALRTVVEHATGAPADAGELQGADAFPGGLRAERAILVLFDDAGTGGS
jgi:hypothetical protein